MIKDLTQIICKYRKIVVSLHRKFEIAYTPYGVYSAFLAQARQRANVRTYLRVSLKFLEYGHKEVCSGNFRK